ncbi:FAD binding domain-containing protein [Thermodesulfobacteriota bacterium]
MQTFQHYNATSIEEAQFYLERYGGRARIIAGGTDLLGKMKDEISPFYPEAVINIKSIPGLDGILEDDDGLRIGALVRLEDIAQDDRIKTNFSALAQAAHRTASPHLREMGTIGGNICQDIRCWYYRKPQNRFPCLRKGGGRCYAIEGDNRYHSIFGGSVKGGCLAVYPSDAAPALIALDAVVRTSRRTIRVEDFFDVGLERTTILEPDEIVLELRIPKPPKKTKSAFIKFAMRKSIDFPIVNCAARVTMSGDLVISARICLNAVYVTPRRVTNAEEVIIGKHLNIENAEEAARAAVIGAMPVRYNRYMVQVAKVLVERSLLGCRS